MSAGLGLGFTRSRGEAALASFSKDKVTGNFIAQAKAAADLTFERTPASPRSLTNVGNPCAADWNSSNCRGTRDRPKVVYVSGSPEPTPAGRGAMLRSWRDR